MSSVSLPKTPLHNIQYGNIWYDASTSIQRYTAAENVKYFSVKDRLKQSIACLHKTVYKSHNHSYTLWFP